MHYLRPAFVLTLFIFPALAFAADTSELGFVPLTSIPGIADAGNASSLPSFLNSLYKLAIGAAAVLAVLQIIRAGIMYMGGDSVTEKKDAKNLIAMSIGGLILVLSPVIVFSIINPHILELKIDGIDALGTAGTDAAKPSTPATELLWSSGTTSRSAADKKCKADGGTISKYLCLAPNGTTRTLAISQDCKAGEVSQAFCERTVSASNTETSAQVQTRCELYDRTIASSGASCSVLVSESSSRLDRACCAGLQEGNQCCGIPKTQTPVTSGPDIKNSIAITRYVYRPITGDPEALGPVPGDKKKYEDYVAACKAGKGTESNKYGSSFECSSADLAAVTDARKTYIRCIPTTVSCTVR